MREHHEAAVKEEVRKLLDSIADKWLREDMPKLYASVVSDMEAGKTKAEILERCAALKGVNEYVMNTIEMTIDHLKRETENLRSAAVH